MIAIVVEGEGGVRRVAFGWRAALACVRSFRRSLHRHVTVRVASIADFADHDTGLPRIPRHRVSS